MVPVASRAQYAEEFRALMALALPAMVSNYCLFATSLTELSVIGHLGVDQLAAVAYAQMSMDFLTLVLFQGFNSGMNALCSQAFGANNYHLLGQYAQLTAFVLTILCVPMALLWWKLDALLLLAGVEENVAAYARLYCQLTILGMWPNNIFQVLSLYYQAQQIVLPTTAINTITVLINIWLATGLTFGLMGLPELGFIGCPLGTALAMWLRLIVYYGYMNVYMHYDRICQWSWSRKFLKMSLLKSLMEVGFPLAAGNLFENTQLQTMALFAASIGEVQLGTNNSMMELFFFATSPIYGLLEASVTLIAKHLGAGRATLARTHAYITGICIGVVAVVNSTAIITFQSDIGRIFSQDPVVIHTFAQIGSLAATGYFFISFFCYAMIVLEAQTRSLPIMSAFIIGSWCVGVPSAYFFGLCQGRSSLMGIWCGMTLGYVVTSIVGFYYAYFKTDWEVEAKLAVERSEEKPDVTEDTPLLPK